MDKIRELVKQIGGSAELADQLVEAVQEYVVAESKKIQEEYKGRLQKAKQVCLEEVAAEKTRIARKIEVYLESKVAAIDRAAGKQRAIEESAAVAQLRQVKKILGEADGNGAELEALNRKLARIAEQTSTIKEERDVAIRKANQANAIAAKTLRRIRILESASEAPAGETAAQPAAEAAPAAESAAKPAEEIQAVRTESEEPVSTTVSQADVAPAAASAAEPEGAAVPSPDEIAASMGEVA